MSVTSCRLLTALRLLAVALIGLHVVAPLFTEEIAWGLWPATYLPAPWRWGLGALALALALFGDRARIRTWPRIGVAASTQRLVLAVCAAVPFYLFRVVHTRWGDAYILVNSIPHPEVRLTYTWQAPLDVFLHAKTWLLGQHLFGWTDAIPAYWLLSVLAGVAFIWVLIGFAGWLGRTRLERGLLLGLLLTLGTIQLFFGYIENYSFMTVGVLLYGWFALRALRCEVALWLPAAMLAVTHAFHPSTLVLAPSLLYLGWTIARQSSQNPVPSARVGHRDVARGWSDGTWKAWRSSSINISALASIALPYTIVGVALLVFMTLNGHGLSSLLSSDFPGGGDHRWFVPLTRVSSRWEHYTMFSAGHLWDIVNEQLLTAPAVWPAVALTALCGWRRLFSTTGRDKGLIWRDNALQFLSLFAGSYLLLLLVWNPDYGGQRDWDLFAPAAIPAALLLAYLLPRILVEEAALRRASWALLAAQAYHTAAWIYQNTRPWSWS